MGAKRWKSCVRTLPPNKGFKASDTFGRARELVSGKGMDVKEDLIQGFLSEKFRFFPNIKFRDFHCSHKLFWDWKSYIVLQSERFNLQMSRVASATLEVCTEVERRSLSRNLDKYQDFGMPWMGKVLGRLPPMMTGRMQLNVLTFRSSVGMIMNKVFVHHQHLRTLLDDLTRHVAEVENLVKLHTAKSVQHGQLATPQSASGLTVQQRSSLLWNNNQLR